MLTATPPPGNPKWKEASREIAFRDRYRQPEGNTCPGDTGREKHQDVNIVFYRFHNRPQAKPVGIHVMLCRTR
ncbi:rCG63175 [Rattus norvegicus]|uniref:RCG63175 n=1 Tax=Rattus norvegicus TaxID=10116 RepID=A6K169_RAT|nr:rCG63175 [Rattus norvegicus]